MSLFSAKTPNAPDKHVYLSEAVGACPHFLFQKSEEEQIDMRNNLLKRKCSQTEDCHSHVRSGDTRAAGDWTQAERWIGAAKRGHRAGRAEAGSAGAEEEQSAGAGADSRQAQGRSTVHQLPGIPSIGALPSRRYGPAQWSANATPVDILFCAAIAFHISGATYVRWYRVFELRWQT